MRSDPATIALANGLAEPAEDGSIVFGPPAGEASNMAAPPALQRAAEDVTAPLPPESPAEQPSPPTGAAGSPEPSSRKPEELDKLAHDLYERIRYRLKNELRLDRERAGLLTDLVR